MGASICAAFVACVAFASNVAKVQVRADAALASVAMSEPETVPLNVPMPRDLHARMKSWAALTGRTIRAFVLEAVEEKLAREKAEGR